MSKKTFLQIVLIFSLLVSGQAQEIKESILSSPNEKQIDSIFAAYDNSNTPGVAIAVLQKGKVTFKKGYGMANLEYDIPIDPTASVFTLASVSKQFTVFAIMLLESQGKLSLKDNVRKYIPELHDYSSIVTLKHLANNTSGLRSDLQLLGMTGVTDDDFISEEMVHQIILGQRELNFDPGEEFRYSNAGFVLLAEVVARVSGKTFAKFMEEEVFKPLKMNDSFIMDDCERLVKNMAYSYELQNGKYKNSHMNYSFVGSTGVFTTIEDFSKWALNFRNPKVGNKGIFRKMNTLGLLNNGKTSIYALGQFVGEYKGLKQIFHSGGNAGYRTYLGRFPEQDFAIILLSNNASFNPQGKALEVVDLLLKQHFNETSSYDTHPTKSIVLSSKQLNKFIGSYLHTKNHYTRNVFVRNDSLIYSREEQGGRESMLVPIGKNKFQLGTFKDWNVLFKNSKSAKTMHLLKEGEEVDVLEKYTTKDYTAMELTQFIGTYFSDELQTTYILEVKDGVLNVTHPKIGAINLSPIKRDAFLSSGWQFSFLEFERGQDKTITGFRISSDRVRNVYFKKSN